MPSPYQIGLAAEAFAAGLFAHAGCEVLVQYGANQSLYDFVAVRRDQLLKVSVKGSQDGGWGLLQSYVENADYHRAADRWLEKQRSDVLFCLVQFKEVPLGECPRVYLAWPTEIAAHMKTIRAGVGYSSLRENYVQRTGKYPGSEKEFLSPGDSQSKGWLRHSLGLI